MSHPLRDTPPVAEDLKARLNQLTSAEFDAMRAVYRDRWLRHWLRNTSWINLFLGGLLVWFSLLHSNPSSLTVRVQLLLGLFTLAQSLWIFVSPTSAILLWLASVSLVTGILNTPMILGLSYMGAEVMIGVVGVAQLHWGVSIYRVYQIHRQLKIQVLEAATIKLYNAAWEAITNGAFKHDPASLYVWVNGSLCQVLLLEDQVVFAFPNWRMLIVQSRSESVFSPNSTHMKGKMRIVGRMGFDNRQIFVTMKRDAFEKYGRWSGEDALQY